MLSLTGSDLLCLDCYSCSLLLDAAMEKWDLLYTDETRRRAAISLSVVCVDLILSEHVNANVMGTWYILCTVV